MNKVRVNSEVLGKLRHFINASPYSFEHVAERIGLTRHGLYLAFKRESLKIDYVYKILDLLGLSESDVDIENRPIAYKQYANIVHNLSEPNVNYIGNNQLIAAKIKAAQTLLREIETML